MTRDYQSLKVLAEACDADISIKRGASSEPPDWHSVAPTEVVPPAPPGTRAVKRTAMPPTDVVLTSASEITMAPIDWLWKHWLACGKLHLLAGAPGQGKTTIALALAAAVSVGGRWPDGTRCPMGNTLIWSGEDDPADTLLPRLVAMGADRSRIFFVTGARVAGQEIPFDPARDLGALSEAVQRVGDVKLMVVDPIVSAVTGDSHKNSEVRRALQPLVDMASAMGAAVLGISHLSKGTSGRDPTERVTGSIAFTAIVRVVLLAAKVQGDDGQMRRVLVRAKSNIGPDDGGVVYALEQTEAAAGITASAVRWGETLQGSARELLREPEGDDAGVSGRSALDAAGDFLRQILADGLTPTKTVEAEAKAAGVAWSAVRRASDSIGVIKRKAATGWYWKLPTPGPVLQLVQPAQGFQPEQHEHVEHLGRAADLVVDDAEDF